ncbi:MAG TPA: glucoamylase family protein [Terracidiphilus sp.]|nr:glucoamylase family protein [Terracidiphilus sp.]
MSDVIAIPPAENELDAETLERLRKAACAVASWEVIPRPPEHNSHFTRRVRCARQALRQLELTLARQPIGPVSDDPELLARRSALLELGASYRMFRAAITAVSDKPRSVAQLPRRQLEQWEYEPRIAGAAHAYLHAVDGAFTALTFCTFVRLLQTNEPLNVDELWRFGSFLRFSLLELLLDESSALTHTACSASIQLLMAHLKSMKSVTHADWVYLIEPLITFDTLLKQDPAGVFAKMDFESRELYRRRIAQVARRSDCTEWQVAQAALELAQQAGVSSSPDSRVQHKRAHVGYYLLDKGFPLLASKVGFHPSLTWRTQRVVQLNAEDFFLSGILLLSSFFLAAVLFPIVPRIDGIAGLLAVLILLITPAMQDAVDLVNSAITFGFDPEPLPKLDFSDGIPRECTTLVAVPTLLLNEKQVRKLLNDLEVRFLGNRDPNLHFALLTDLPDSASKPRDRDSHPLVGLAVSLIGELNAKYPSRDNGAFVLLHRHRIFNSRHGVWMGWERKRGKLLDLNKLLVNEFDAFPIKAGAVGVLENVRYVLTLDADSQLPAGAAARLAGAIAHPLNQAIIDPILRIVTEGFGILQPRIGVAVRSTAGSRLAAFFSGQCGVDLYARAISDAYQDLFGEGIFTGKGIYEVATLHAVLDRRFPRNSLLSHDLIEGAYARAGLVTDVELVDDYPSHFSAYIRRKHRWVRGDWQIAQWMLSRVPDETGRNVANPISNISRWKIFENLRRSLVDPALFLLFVTGWTCLPGGPLYWTIILLLMLFFPAAVQFVFSLGRGFTTGNMGQTSEALAGLSQASIVAILQLAFLPHNTLLAFDAILRSLVRRFITGERLLEWETAAQSEMQTGKRASVDRYLSATPAVALSVAALIWLFAAQRWAIFCALPILALWALADPITVWLNHPPREQRRISPGDREFLTEHALQIWRYFCEFSTEKHNYLIPDNVKEEGLDEAARVSPTNIGLLLNSRQTACELGFITVPEFAALTSRTLESIERLEKYRGHLYNWYDTRTLQPLDASPFVSSVDSGNFAASLFTLHSGAHGLANKPLLAQELFDGLRAYMRLLLSEKHISRALSRVPMPGSSADKAAWIAWLPGAQTDLEAMSHANTIDSHYDWWIRETLQRVKAIARLLEDYLPWLMPQFTWLRAVRQLGLDKESFDFNCAEAIQFAEELRFTIATAHRALAADATMAAALERLLDLLPAAIQNLRNLASNLHSIGSEAERLTKEMDFSFLVDPYRRILSIGFDVGAHRQIDSCYDLIASEARIATFVAIARGDIPQQSWLKLGRDYTFAYGRFLLLSWSGTMFEYLMPALWMRSYPGTMIALTQDACVHVQQAYGHDHGIPWGVSESGSSHKNDRGDYHYFAYGIPRLALWFEATAGPVVSPYSTFLTLAVDPPKALRNLRRMESAHWTGTYGFYEAADYSASRRHPVLVKEWMAHHLGMSLLAITNLLRNHVVQQWFHEHPIIQAAEMLLQEMPVSRGILRARMKEIAPIRSRTRVQRSENRVGLKAAL